MLDEQLREQIWKQEPLEGNIKVLVRPQNNNTAVDKMQ